MRTVLVYIDDADYGLDRLERLPQAGQQHWVLVACAPKMTHRIGKWVSHSSRENWRSKWADKLFGIVVPALQARGHRVTALVARSPLPQLAEELLLRYPDAQLEDLRRPKLLSQPMDLAHATAPVPAPAPVVTIKRRWNLPGAVAGLMGMAVVFSE
jgi:hypothetical protein